MMLNTFSYVYWPFGYFFCQVSVQDFCSFLSIEYSLFFLSVWRSCFSVQMWVLCWAWIASIFFQYTDSFFTLLSFDERNSLLSCSATHFFFYNYYFCACLRNLCLLQNHEDAFPPEVLLFLPFTVESAIHSDFCCCITGWNRGQDPFFHMI